MVNLDQAVTINKQTKLMWQFLVGVAYQYRDRGIRVSTLCPMGVDTPLLMEGLSAGAAAAKAVAASGQVLGVEAVAEAVVQGLAEERFLILPHPEVKEYMARKLDRDRWLRGMRRLRDKSGEGQSRRA